VFAENIRKYNEVETYLCFSRHDSSILYR